MKILYFLVFFLFLFTLSYSQDVEKTRIYEIRSNIPAFACNVMGNSLMNDTSFSTPPYKSKFAVVRYRNDSVVIRFLDWKQEFKELRKKYNKDTILYRGFSGDSTVVINRYFLITRNDLDSNCIKIYNSGLKSSLFTLGLVTMPMKIRLGKDFDFQGNLSLGTTAGVKVRMSEYNPNYFNILLGASISTVSLDSFSTKGKVSGQPLTNIAVFSPSLGFVFEFGKAQAGLFLGWDLLNNSTQSKYNWIYNGKPWLSIGFGFSIFNIDSKSSSAVTDKNTTPQ